MAAVQLKPPRNPAQRCPGEQKKITFLHPGSFEGTNILLMLPAVDAAYDQDSDTVRYGVHHQTAQTACAILADCAWHGTLSTEPRGPALTQGPDEVLLEPRYYFCLAEHDYPVIPSWEHFPCPSVLPPAWGDKGPSIEPSLLDDAAVRDTTCRITASGRPNEIAHIIPRAQTDWWRRNNMLQYIISPTSLSGSTDCSENSLLLRSDVHQLWDDNFFAIVPKAGKWVVHVLKPFAEMETDYQNLELQTLRGVPRHFLFCRFALAVLAKSVFLHQGFMRHLITINSGGIRFRQKLTAYEFRKFFPPTARASSRTLSQKKRQRSAALSESNGTDESSSTWHGKASSSFSSSSEEEEEKEQGGRLRKRQQ